jgi:hypothetical protein
VSWGERRNRRHVEAGTATLLLTPLAEADLPEEAFDVAFAVHVDRVLRDDVADAPAVAVVATLA